jgi:hypothetical protein
MAYAARNGRLTSTRKRLNAAWSAAVDSVEAAIWRFNDEHALASDCEVVFFEIAADEKLHVNVTHRRLTKEIRGWAGPADTPDGFVHNRIFGATPTPQLVRNIREMVFAGRVTVR